MSEEGSRFAATLAALHADRRSGAAELARRALAALADHSSAAPAAERSGLVHALSDAADALIASRPSMAAIASLVGQWRDALQHLPSDLSAARAAARSRADELAERSRVAAVEAATHAAAALPDRAVVVTLSYSSTVALALERAAGRAVSAIVGEGRPGREGVRLVERLAKAGMPTTLVTDAALGPMARRADAALIGADTLLADGAVVNKVGSWLLALAAREAGIPLYVCCEGFKRLPPGAPPPELEIMAASELEPPDMPAVRGENPYFEIVPAGLVTAWFTEEGRLDPPFPGATDPGQGGGRGKGAPLHKYPDGGAAR